MIFTEKEVREIPFNKKVKLTDEPTWLHGPSVVNAATLNFRPSSGNFTVGNIFTIDHIPKIYQDKGVFQIVGITETLDKNSWITKIRSQFRVFNNVNYMKLRRLNRAISSYLGYAKIPEDQEWQIDGMAVFIDLEAKRAKIRLTEDIDI